MDKKVATYRGKDLNDYEHEALKILVQGLAPDPEEYRIHESLSLIHISEPTRPY